MCVVNKLFLTFPALDFLIVWVGVVLRCLYSPIANSVSHIFVVDSHIFLIMTCFDGIHGDKMNKYRYKER